MIVRKLDEFMLKRGGSIDPRKFKNETFELLSIPAFDRDQPEILKGEQIGSAKKIVKPNDVLLSKIVPHIRRCWVVPKDKGYRQIASGEWIQFRSDDLAPDYLRYFLTSDPFHSQFMKTVSGVGGSLLRASPAKVAEIEIPLPPLDDQKRIAHLLGKVEGLIAQRKQHLLQLDDLLKSVFLDMFGDPVRNEKGWETSTIEGLCEAVIDCPHSTPKYSEVDTGYYCVRSSDIVEGYLNLTNTYQVEKQVFDDRIARYRPQQNDIVYSREGGRLGNAARIIDQEQICLGQRMMLFKVSSANRSEFLWALLESVSFKSKLRGLIGGGAAPRVNIKDLKKIVVANPDPDLQLHFSKFVLRIDELKKRYQQSLLDLESLYGALSQKAFKGELDLSRVPLPDQAEPKEREIKITDIATADDQIKINEYPMSDPQSRKGLLLNLFEEYLNEKKDQQLMLDDFWQHASWNTMDLMDEFDKHWNVDDYEQLKEWVFERIRDGRLEQSFLDDANRVQLIVKG
ncbi:MAG: restriction endonuclease subunit S [Chromatiaceae bacterium]|nr:restriction endonuclease subunit S [Chromatiaceae bacterium]